MLLWKAIKGLGLVIGLLIVGLGWLLWQGLCLLWQVVLGIADAMEPAPADRSAPGESQKVFTSVQPPLSIFALWSYRETSMVLNSLNIQYCPCWGFSYLDGQLVISGARVPAPTGPATTGTTHIFLVPARPVWWCRPNIRSSPSQAANGSVRR